MMWVILGGAAIVTAILNVIWAFLKKEAKWFRFASLALTALTLCAFYSDEAARVVEEDWIGLMDIMPAMSQMLWALTGASIIINSVSLFRSTEK